MLRRLCRRSILVERSVRVSRQDPSSAKPPQDDGDIAIRAYPQRHFTPATHHNIRPHKCQLGGDDRFIDPEQACHRRTIGADLRSHNELVFCRKSFGRSCRSCSQRPQRAIAFSPARTITTRSIWPQTIAPPGMAWAQRSVCLAKTRAGRHGGPGHQRQPGERTFAGGGRKGGGPIAATRPGIGRQMSFSAEEVGGGGGGGGKKKRAGPQRTFGASDAACCGNNQASPPTALPKYSAPTRLPPGAGQGVSRTASARRATRSSRTSDAAPIPSSIHIAART